MLVECFILGHLGQSGATPATLPVSGPCLLSDTRCTTIPCSSRSRGGLGQSHPASPALGAAWRAREISLRSVSNLKSTRVLQHLLTQLVSGYYALRPVATVHRNDFPTHPPFFRGLAGGGGGGRGRGPGGGGGGGEGTGGEGPHRVSALEYNLRAGRSSTTP